MVERCSLPTTVLWVDAESGSRSVTENGISDGSLDSTNGGTWLG
ncbi:MAG: hypothetical protein ACJAZO_001007 [Myxococcota bacterium]|jgi:hypothetical protein